MFNSHVTTVIFSLGRIQFQRAPWASGSPQPSTSEVRWKSAPPRSLLCLPAPVWLSYWVSPVGLKRQKINGHCVAESYPVSGWIFSDLGEALWVKTKSHAPRRVTKNHCNHCCWSFQSSGNHQPKDRPDPEIQTCANGQHLISDHDTHTGSLGGFRWSWVRVCGVYFVIIFFLGCQAE